MSNRVAELESKVSELQAAVDGLTEELVETRARLTALEEEVDPESGDLPTDGAAAPDPAAGEAAPADVPGDADAGAGADAEKDSPEEDAGEASEDGDSLDDSDIIVA